MSLLELFDRSRTQSLQPDTPEKYVRLPSGYQRQVAWLPQIGDIFPSFNAPSTQGAIDFHDWAEGHWVVMLSHPSTKSAVSATEWCAIADLQSEFDALGVKVLGVCCEQAVDHARWEAQMGADFDVDVTFPTIEDTQGKLSTAFGMIHPKQGCDFAIRKTFIIDPSLRIMMTYEYPINVGRSIDEILRTVAALQLTHEHRVGVPADWDQGQRCLVAPYVTDAQAIATHGSIQKVNPYFRIIDCPTGPAGGDTPPPPPQSVSETYTPDALSRRGTQS